MKSEAEGTSMQGVPQPGQDEPILRVRDLKKSFPVRRGLMQRTRQLVRAVDGVDLDIAAGRTLGLVGESGCGKSTVARMILRLLKPDSGTIRFEGRAIEALSEKQFKPLRRSIQMIFQDPYSSLNPRMTVAQSIAEGVRIAGIAGRRQQRERIEELLTMVGMPPAVADRYPHEFSGGQRQRVGIARALSVAPRLVLCDEPISALDVSIQAQIINLLKDLQDQLGLSYLFISHDLNVVSYICDYVCVMYRGRIVESAPADALFDDPRHPYTHQLLASAPSQLSKSEQAPPVAARRDPLQPGACTYAHQCPEMQSACLERPTAMHQVGPDHWVRCPAAAGKTA